jgi:hypothetical protein
MSMLGLSIAGTQYCSIIYLLKGLTFDNKNQWSALTISLDGWMDGWMDGSTNYLKTH